VRNPQYPYVSCLPLATDEGVEPNWEEYETILVSFAHLLLEIEVGHTIESSSSAKSEVTRALHEVLDQIYGAGDCSTFYHEAIEGCLRFKDSKEATQNSREPDSYLIRQFIYEYVIKHLECHLSCFKNIDKSSGRRSLPVEEPSPPAERIFRGLRSTPSNSISGSGEHIQPASMMFDGQRASGEHP
jgi:hypothetical protein